MRFEITLTYSDIFDGPIPTIDELVKDIPSSTSITVLAMINAEIYLDKSMDRQFKIIRLILQRQPESVKNIITEKIAAFLARGKVKSINVFSTRCSLEFIHNDLINYRSGDLTDLSVEQELNFFKAYLLISEGVYASHLKPFTTKIDTRDAIESKLWPILIGQFQIDHPISPVFEIPKSIELLNYFEHNSGMHDYVNEFLKLNSKATSWNYILDVVGLFPRSQLIREREREFFPFIIKPVTEFQSLLSNFSIDVSEYQSKYNEKKSSYSGLKERPLFNTIDGKFLVMSWDFLARKVYDGFVFDFYKLTGISKLPKFKTFLLYKNFISSEVIEKSLFRKVIKKLFSNKHDVVLFDGGQRNGFPDAYVRQGKYIFLFEIKDALFPSQVIDSFSFQEIKGVIDERYNNISKGTGQLIKQLQFLKDNNYEVRSFENLKIKRRNLVVYPILIYTDRHFGMPGFNKYLAEEFEVKLKEANLCETFGMIKKLSFIGLSFLTDNIDLLSQPSNSLKNIIDEYHNKINSAERKFKKSVSIENSLATNENIETVFQDKHKTQLHENNREYIKTIVETLGLTKYLK